MNAVRCAAAYLGDIALTEDELGLLGVTNSVRQKPSAAVKPPPGPALKPPPSALGRKPPPPPPAPLHRPRDSASLERRRQRRRRRRKQWRLSSSAHLADVDQPTTGKHRRRGGRQHRQSAADQSQHKRYKVAVSRVVLAPAAR